MTLTFDLKKDPASGTMTMYLTGKFKLSTGISQIDIVRNIHRNSTFQGTVTLTFDILTSNINSGWRTCTSNRTAKFDLPTSKSKVKCGNMFEFYNF